MIQKSIGLARNLHKKRDLVMELVKRIILADEILLITLTDNNLVVSGQTSDDAVNVVMLGTAAAAGHVSAKKREPDLELNQYLEQINTVAFKRQDSFT